MHHLRDGFRLYNPVGQQQRMVTLFTSLYAEAGIGPEKPARATPARSPAPKVRVQASVQLKPKAGAARKPATVAQDGVPPALAGLLSSLPDPESGWTRAQRDKFVATFGTVLDFCFPIVTAKAAAASEEDESELAAPANVAETANENGSVAQWYSARFLTR